MISGALCDTGINIRFFFFESIKTCILGKKVLKIKLKKVMKFVTGKFLNNKVLTGLIMS